jgi:hypothetical protein
MANILYNAIRTPDGTILESNHRYDYKTHTDANGKTYMIDGGLSYCRSTRWEDQEWIGVTDEDDFSEIRLRFKWGTRGKNGDQPLQYKPLYRLDDDHIRAILDTQTHLPEHIRVQFEKEMAWRGK